MMLRADEDQPMLPQPTLARLDALEYDYMNGIQFLPSSETSYFNV